MSRARILVVEDEAIVAADIEERLARMGYEVVQSVASADRAVENATQNAPDLVLMDIKLKGEKRGIEAAQEIQTRMGIPVVYLTSYADDSTLEQAKLTEPFGFIVKPFKNVDLRANIEMGLYRHKLEKERAELADKLKEALAAVKTLSGLLPICAWCKRIRDDAGYWSEVEEYMREHADVEFTHSCCPDCHREQMKEFRK